MKSKTKSGGESSSVRLVTLTPYLVIRTAGAIILMISYGYEVKEGRDPLVDIATQGLDQFSQGSTPGAFLVDTFPIRLYRPLFCLIGC